MASTLDAHTPYPASLDSRPPIRFSRLGVAYRLLIVMGLGVLHQSAGGLLGALYVILPIVATILIARNGGQRYLTENAGAFVPVLDWIVAFYAYLFFVTDDFPLDARGRVTHLRIRPEGTPTPGSALVRLVTSLPHALLLGLLGVASALIWVIEALAILGTERCPNALRSFQRDLVAWMARVLAYHASLVEAYPPFSF